MDAVDAIFRHDAIEIPNVKADHRMIHAVARTNAGDDDLVAAGLQIELLQHRFHRSLVEAVVRGFLHDVFARHRPELVDEIRARTADEQTVGPAEDAELRMILGAHGLHVNKFSVHCAKAIEQAADVADYRFHAGTVTLATLHLHVDDHQSRGLWLKCDFRFTHCTSSRL